MEVDKTLSEKIEKEVPRVPIKTYQWEEVRRSRKKGGYPWTHLTKPPYDGEEDPEEYTLEAYRQSRSRSTSTLGKARSGSASTFGDRSPSPSFRKEENNIDHSRTPSTVKVEQGPSGSKDEEEISSSKHFLPNLGGPSTFVSRYERSLSPSFEKIERSQSLNRDLLTRTFERSKSPSRSLPENRTESPSSQRRSRSPTKRDNTNSLIQQLTTKMDNGTKEEIQESPDSADQAESVSNILPEEIPDSSKTISEPVTKDTKPKRTGSLEPRRKLKRRLSVQSSYSRISLTKQSILDRIKSTKQSLRIPRIVKRSKSDVTHEKKPINTKGRRSIDATKYPPDPVYIHIPLKPPPGQTDEFSYLEFEDNPPPVGQLNGKRNGKKELFSGDRDGSPIVGVILEFDDPDKKEGISATDIDQIISKIGNGASVQQIDAKDLFPEITEQSAKIKEIVDNIEDKAKIVATNGSEVLDEIETTDKRDVLERIKRVERSQSRETTPKSDIKYEENSKELQQKRSENSSKVQDSDRLQIQEMSNGEGSIASRSSRSSLYNNKPIVVEPDEDNISQYLDRSNEHIENISDKNETAKPEVSNNSATSEFNETFRPLKGSDLDVSNPLKGRAKSEEPPTRKRKLSIDSSYSRKSLSKLAFLKKIKNFTEKIKLPSFGKNENKDKEKSEIKPENTAKSTKKGNNISPKKEEPKYIYIPLKPPEGETDEFSKFAEENGENASKKLDRQDTQTSENTTLNDVQLIILTPPSDDEVLENNPPETPSESSNKFFDNIQIDNLKSLAKKAVDEFYTDSKKLQTVQEERLGSEEEETTEEKQDEKIINKETGIEKGEETKQEIESLDKKNKEENKDKREVGADHSTEKEEGKDEKIILQEHMLVDEEDGLQLSEAAIAMIKDELAKEYLNDSPSENRGSRSDAEEIAKVRKKVLFKQKKRTDDGEYEDISIPDSERTTKKENDEDNRIKEDVELIKKDGSSKSDGKKWSKDDDHEYEPINPPPDEMAHNGPPEIHITTPQQQLHLIHDAPPESALSSTTSLERQYLGAVSGDDDLGDREADIQEAMETNEPLTPQQLQLQIEERFFKNAAEDTDETRENTEANTDQVDSSTIDSEATKKERKKTEKGKTEGQGGRFNEALKNQAEAWKTQAGKIKSKFQNLKKPNISLPQRSKFQAPTFKMPKMGDRAKINLPTFKKSTEKRSWQQQRQFSTESNVGEPKKHFDFSTFPKLFDRRKKERKDSIDDFEVPSNEQPEEDISQPEFATVPRVNRKKGPVGSRWADKFSIGYADDETEEQKPLEETQESTRITLHDNNEEVPPDATHIHFNKDIDMDGEDNTESKEVREVPQLHNEYLKRWEHGEFHEGPTPAVDSKNEREYKVTDLDIDELQTPPELERPRHNGLHSSGSLSDHRRGVIEEIDSDEFFLREKGISQENIEVGKYLSSEIREAFRNPINSLAQIERRDGFGREFEMDASDMSLQERPPRKRPSRKPKKRRSPQISHEDVSFDQDSVTTEPEEYQRNLDEMVSYPPARPKRKSKSRRLKKPVDDVVVPFQESIPADEEGYELSRELQERLKAIESDILPDNILNPRNISRNSLDDFSSQMYENEQMQGIEQPEIMISDVRHQKDDLGFPRVPPRKHRSLKSLDISEQDSIFDDINAYKDIPKHEDELHKMEHEYIVPTPEPPARSKKIRSRSQSQTVSQIEDDRTSRGAESIGSENLVPCVEEICVKDIRDSSGYAIIDKQRPRDPPLPPSRFPPSPPKKRKNKTVEKTKVITETKFFTVPRPQSSNLPPERPTRNYSTLGSPTKPARKKSTSASDVNIEEKENFDATQYIEIEEEPVKRLQSGEIIQKMRDRPLPAPPRPPRKQRDGREPLQDITNGEDISENREILDETEVSTQTEPLPDGFICEPLVQEESDRIIIPSEDQKTKIIHHPDLFEETITHAALVVQPIDNANILPHSTFSEQAESQERVIPTVKEEDDYDEETSEIPEDFKKLKSPEFLPSPVQKPEEILSKTTPTSLSTELKSHELSPSPVQEPQEVQCKTPPRSLNTEVDFLKTRKLQVQDLDVERLRVNELQASKIMVSDIEGLSIQVNEINSRSGNLVVSGIELPPQLLQQLLDQLQSIAHIPSSTEVDQGISQATESESTLVAQQSLAEEQPVDKVTTPTDQQDILAQSETESCLTKEGEEKEDINTAIAEQESCLEEKEAEVIHEADTAAAEQSSFAEMKVKDVDTIVGQENYLVETEAEGKNEIDTVVAEQSSLIEVETQESIDIEQKKTSTDNSLTKTDAVNEEKCKDDHDPELFHNVENQELPKRPPRKSSAASLQNSSNGILEEKYTKVIASTKSEDEPPPRPPQPEFVPSQPPPSFYALRSEPYVEILSETIPMPPRRKRHPRAVIISRSSSEDNSSPPRQQKSPEPTIPQLTGQLIQACGARMEEFIRRLITHFTENVLKNKDGKQDAHVMIIILLILIAGILLLTSDPKVTIHHHHWEYFNPPKEL